MSHNHMMQLSHNLHDLGGDSSTSGFDSIYSLGGSFVGLTRPIPTRPMSNKFRREKNEQAKESHAKLVQMEKLRVKVICEKMSYLMACQISATEILKKGMAEVSAVSSFLERLVHVQIQLGDDLKEGFDDIGVNCDCSHAPPNDAVVAETKTCLASRSLHKSAQLMVFKINNLGCKTLLRVLHLIRRISNTFKEQQEEMDILGRNVVKIMRESQMKVEQAWEKYCRDASAAMDPDVSNGGHIVVPTDSSENDAVYQLNSRRLSTDGSSHRLSPADPSFQRVIPNGFSHRMSPDGRLSAGGSSGRLSASGSSGRLSASGSSGRLSGPESLHQTWQTMSRESSFGPGSSQALPSADVWLSEWSYRTHLFEHVSSLDGAMKRMQELCKSIKDTDAMRHVQMREALLDVAKTQQRLAVNLEAASNLSLWEYFEEQDQLAAKAIKQSEHGDLNGTTTNDAILASTGSASSNRSVKAFALPSLTKSGFATLVSLAKRAALKEGSRHILCLLVVTTDGILYFFDLPEDSNVTFDTTHDEAAWEAILAQEAKRQFTKATEGPDGLVVVVPPPMPSLRFVMAKCSIELTNEDCAVQFCVPPSLGEDFLVLLPSRRIEIAFIDNFHAGKYADMDPNSDPGGSDSISRSSTSSSNDDDDDDASGSYDYAAGSDDYATSSDDGFGDHESAPSFAF